MKSLISRCPSGGSRRHAEARAATTVEPMARVCLSIVLVAVGLGLVGSWARSSSRPGGAEYLGLREW